MPALDYRLDGKCVQDFVEDVLYDEVAIQKRCQEIADHINREYNGRHPVVVCTLNGSLPFCADILKRLTIPCHLETVLASSYVNDADRGMVSSEKVVVEIRGK